MRRKKNMTEKENLLHVLNHTGKAEWIPIFPDCFFPIIPDAIWDRPHNQEDGYDWFGCYWHYDSDVQGYAMPPDHPFPLTDITNWKEEVRFPDLDQYDWAAGAKKDLADFAPSERMLFAITESGPFERLHQMLGFAEAFIAMYDEPEAFKELMDALADFRIKLCEKIIDHYPVDVLMIMDDLGCQKGPLLSLDMYREFIKPYDKKIIDYIHSRNVKVAYHSCGSMEVFIPDLVEIGADLINPLQGGINDQLTIAKEYEGKTVFDGGLNNFVHLPSTTEEELRAEVDRLMDTFWDHQNLIVEPRSFTPAHIGILMDEARSYNARRRKTS